MCSDSEPRLALDVPFGEVDVALGRGVDDFDVDALTRAWADVGGDDDEGVRVGCVPYAFFSRDFSWWKDEFDGGGEREEKEKEEGGEHGST